MNSLDTYHKWWYKISKSKCLVVKLIKLRTLYLRMQVLIIWVLPQKLGVANRTASLDLLQKVKLLLLLSTLNPDWRICLVERRYIYMLGIQYTGNSCNTATLVVSFSFLRIEYFMFDQNSAKGNHK